MRAVRRLESHHGRDDVRLEDCAFFRVASFKARLAVLDDARHAFHHRRLLLAHITLQTRRRKRREKHRQLSRSTFWPLKGNCCL
eukprot:3514342-Rhodomonas_salina.1